MKANANPMKNECVTQSVHVLRACQFEHDAHNVLKTRSFIRTRTRRRVAANENDNDNVLNDEKTCREQTERESTLVRRA
jgi:hypothetical protein